MFAQLLLTITWSSLSLQKKRTVKRPRENYFGIEPLFVSLKVKSRKSLSLTPSLSLSGPKFHCFPKWWAIISHYHTLLAMGARWPDHSNHRQPFPLWKAWKIMTRAQFYDSLTSVILPFFTRSALETPGEASERKEREITYKSLWFLCRIGPWRVRRREEKKDF